MRTPAVLIGLMLLLFGNAGCFFGGKRAEVVTPVGEAEPDKILYEKGLKDVAKGRYEVARLTFQTLLNTYPDSDYQEKAKLAMADSFYKQGGTSGLVQAAAEYKDFMTFFPTSEDADDAKLRIAMTHYRQMEKPDRDATQARNAETEFQGFVDEFPDSPLVDEARQYLREVQEVLAEGDLRVAQHEMIRKNYRGAVGRAVSAIDKYPDFSRQDAALYVLAQAKEKQKQILEAGYYYGKIVSLHPLSDYEDDARRSLERLNLPIPEVNAEALARAQAEQEMVEKRGFMGRILGFFSKKPNLSAARRASRPPIQLAPDERINLEAARTAGTAQPAPPVGGQTESSVGVEVVNTPAAKSPPKSSGDPQTERQ